jgi:signal-transduction protein with cAMP-binding, CBS, and nucleotidyltransferase domain
MNTVRTMLDMKGHDVFSIGPDASVYQAVESMATKEVGALIVVTEDNKVAGIISERDYARKVILKNKASRETKIHEIMTKDVIYVEESTAVDTCMSLMSQKNIRHLPVVKDGAPVGMVTVDDLLKFTIRDQKIVIAELESYVMEEVGGES